ncbi:potassium channel family protein [Salinibaculum salinum]|uniref:potassium channel family protein n=1 Tax=Salinibaculum salinum TaxID=3131996 RepID=UPI0030EEFAD5
MRTFEYLDRLPLRGLTRRQRLLVVYVVGVVSVVGMYTLLYSAGMRYLEGRPRTLFHSLQIVTETMTTTGYGADSPWVTPWMNLFMVTMQVTGILIGFVALRVLVIPLFERTPLNLDDRLSVKSGHVVVAEYERDSEVLLDELEQLDVGYVLIESDEEEAKQLSDDGYQIIHGDAETREDLERATIDRASVLITDAGDRTASIVLTALEANEDLRVISFTESTRRTAALAEVGVDRSVAPHALIGRRLAEKATMPVAVEGSPDDDEVAIREVLIRRDSTLHGVRVGDSPIVEHPNLTLVAGWFDGELRLPPSPDDQLTPNAVLVVAGPASEIDDLAREVAGVRIFSQSTHSKAIVAGLGEGGLAAVETFAAGCDVTTVDADPATDPDVLGDVTEPETLQAAGIDSATALVVTVDDDATALLTVAMARALSDDVEILARTTDTEKTTAAFRAGADYVLSVQRLCARLVASEVHGERVMDPVSQIRLVRTGPTPFVGETLGELRRDATNDWTVVGLVRSGTVYTDAGTTVEADDEVFIAGSDGAIQEFERTVDRQ